MKKSISILSRLTLFISAIMLAACLFVPIWQIDLDAPQYPEGLRLLIRADGIAGDVDIINGLNHYIGMKTLHTGDFIEFTLLPYIIGAFALLFLAAAIAGRKKWLYLAFGAFVVFGIVAMVDFWRWEYNYGHDLDPNAAIVVPGMAYQPPLIGFKQLLNFGAFSMPDTGGWLFVAAGALLLIAVLRETGALKKRSHNRLAALKSLAASSIFLFASCGDPQPEAININTDACEFCRMTISEGRFATELVTSKGRVYKFDDIVCMMGYAGQLEGAGIRRYYVSDQAGNNNLIDATTAWYVRHDEVKSPMGGNTAAFAGQAAAEEYAAKLHTTPQRWEAISATKNGQHAHEHH